MFAVVCVMSVFVLIQHMLQCRCDWTPVLGTWEIDELEWEAARPLPPADDTSKPKALNIIFLEPSLEDIEKCALHYLHNMSTPSLLLTEYINGDYQPPAFYKRFPTPTSQHKVNATHYQYY